MPRHETPVWQYFIKVPVVEHGAKYKSGKCTFCNQIYITNAARMEKHLREKCTACPPSVKQIFRTGHDHDLGMDASLACTSDSFPTSKGPVPKHKYTNITSFVDAVPPEMKTRLDTAFARAVYSSALALSVTESEYWKEFFQLIRPAWSPPSRYQLSNTLLDAEYQNVQSNVTEKIKAADSLTVMSDGWTDVNGNSVINIIVATPEPVFHSAIQSTTQAHTGAYISDILGQAIEQIGSNKVNAVVTDNASNMKLAWKLLQQRFPHLIIYGCLAHGINLLIKDIVSIPTIQKLIDNAKAIIKFFRNSQIAKQILKKVQIENGGKEMALLMPVETRWGSQYAAIDSLLRTKDHLQMAVMHKEISAKITAAVKRNLLDEEHFWPTLLKVNALIEPPSSLIKSIEGDKPNLSYFAMNIKRMFADLGENLSFLNTDEEKMLKASYARRQGFLFHPIQLAAHVLNPKLDHFELSEHEEQQAVDTIRNQARVLNLDCNLIMIDLGEYLGKSSIWAVNSVWEAAKHMTPTAWWKGFCSRRELSKLAIIILNLPSTAAACERNWSTFSNIKTVKRNRLDQERTTKLVAIKYNLSLLKNAGCQRNSRLEESVEDNNGNCNEIDDPEIDNPDAIDNPDIDNPEIPEFLENVESEENDECELEEEWLDMSILEEVSNHL